ncbi:hypothetical protein BU17DRAFT_75241 [Hysterangium stoloniferum]|nr:hypothetical protein BU17DRAFT_75241 [Hysterangium stoloniferum]
MSLPETVEQESDEIPMQEGNCGSQMQAAKLEGRKGDTLGLGLVVGGSILLVAGTWIAILSNDPGSLGLFAFHPPLQTVAVALFACGILTLQPTSQPKTKQAGLNRHQLIILGFAFPCIAVGTLIIIWNKNIHDSPHFVTWHATFGIIAIVWMLIQMFLGAASVWYGGALFGGGAKAKSIWKYHRLSGYLLYPFFLTTIAIGGGWSSWTTANMATIARVFTFGIGPAAILTGLWSRARPSKMKFV